MGLGMESGACHHITIAIRRWATASRQHTYRRTQRRHNSSQPTSSSSYSQEAAGKGPTSPANVASHSLGQHEPKPMRAAPRSIRQIIKSSAVGRVADVYKRAQTRRPWVTQMVCTAVIYLIGDLNAQYLFSDDGNTGKEGDEAEVVGMEEEKKEVVGKGYDPLRTLRHLSIGIVASVPSYTWFMYVHNHFNFTSKILSVAVKVFVQQVTFTPIFNIYFFSMQSLLAGATLSDTAERLKKAVPTSVYNSFKLWPAVTAFSFVYVGPEFRPLFFGAIAVGWQTYLSWLNQNAAKEVQTVDTDTVEATRLQSVLDGNTLSPGAGTKT